MISVIIPVYKNTKIFLTNLKKNIKFLKECQIIIVNDDPERSIKSEIKKIKAKNIILVENKKNLGFGQSVNIGAKYAKGDYLFLLNTDVILNNKNYLHGLKYFKKNPNLFAVSFAQLEKNKQIVGKNILYFKEGLFHHQKANDLAFGKNAWAEGGATLIDKKKFDFLGGFDPIYSPFYWEDVDLSYRAWKAGFWILFDPKVLVEHHHQSTISKYFNQNKIKTIAYRNQLIFTLKNSTDLELIVKFIFFFFKRLIKAIMIFDFIYLRAVIAFILKVPLIIIKKTFNNKIYKISDKKIISFFENG
jgi:GT2 family glycosyltransferase